jgi:hypothetical protein
VYINRLKTAEGFIFINMTEENLKTIKDFSNNVSGFELRLEAMNWIKAIRKRSLEHWKKIDKYGFTDFPIIEKPDNFEDPYCFIFKQTHFDDWQERTDVHGAVRILMLFFDITEEDLK